MRVLVIFLAVWLVGCASHPVRSDMSTIPVVRDVPETQRRAERRAERRRKRARRIDTAAAVLEVVDASVSAAVAIKESEAVSPPPAEPSLDGPLPLLLVGDDYGKTFLGCLSCDPYDIASVFNAEGDHGSRHSPVSIRNRFSRFGSTSSDYSSCNPRATRPPLIVDAHGEVRGRFTVNASVPGAAIDGVTLRLAHMLCTRPLP